MSSSRSCLDRSVCAAALLVADRTASAAKLWIVSPSGCPNVHFAEIQPAVDAAADGDVILVRSRTDGLNYASFVVDGKSLAIVGDGLGTVPVSPAITIQNLATWQPLLLAGLEPGIEPIRLTFENELVVQDCRGSVWVQECRFTGQGNPAATVSRSTSALFTTCVLEGSDGNPLHAPGVGLAVNTSWVYVYDSTVKGGDAPTFFPGVAGQVGAVVSGTAILFASGTTITGGTGTVGTSSPFGCTAGGQGLDAVVLVNRLSFRVTLDSPLIEGAGGEGGCIVAQFGLCETKCADGPPGTRLSGLGIEVPLPGTARSFTSTSPVKENDIVSFSLIGDSGDVAVLFGSFSQQITFFPQYNGILGPAAPGFAPFVGVVPASGSIDQSGPMTATMVPPFEAEVRYAQGLFVDTAARIYFGTPFAWVILDENHDPKDGCP